MEDYVKCEVCGKHLRVVNAAHLKTHGMTLSEYNEFVARKRRKAFLKLIPTTFIGTISGILGNLLTPLVKSLFKKIIKTAKYIEGLKYKLIISVVTITVVSSVLVYQSFIVKRPPPKPEIPIEPESEDLPPDLNIDPLNLIFPLRSQSKILSWDEVDQMLKNFDFFHSSRHRNGHGINNQFEVNVFNGDTVVIDHSTKLMWQQGNSSKLLMTFNKAQRWLKEFNSQGYAGYNDWRLPTLEELMSIMESEKKNNDGYIDSVFNNRPSSWFLLSDFWLWTSDSLDIGGNTIWCINFTGGYCIGMLSFCYCDVRAVRSLQ